MFFHPEKPDDSHAARSADPSPSKMPSFLPGEGGALRATLHDRFKRHSSLPKDDLHVPARLNQEDRLKRAHSASGFPTYDEIPALHTLIGRARAEMLDRELGELVYPKNVHPSTYLDYFEQPIKKHEFDEVGGTRMNPDRLFISVDDGAVSSHPDAVAKLVGWLKKGEPLMWSASKLGRLIVGPQTRVTSIIKDDALATLHNLGKDEEKPRLSHPALVGGGQARISGEVYIDSETRKVVVTDRSGRYSKYGVRNAAHLENAAAIIAKNLAGYGLAVQVSKKAYEKNKQYGQR
jgi:hypothetical protein